MIDPLDLLEERLHQAGKKVIRRGDQLQAQCPAHDDHNPSMSATIGDQRDIVVHCHANCDPGSILSALNLNWTDFGDKTKPNDTLTEWVYRDAEGRPVYRVIKRSGKRFHQESLDHATGEWRPTMRGVQRLPYRLPEILEGIKNGETIWIVEGEKDADAIVAAGGNATCNSGGAGKFGKLSEWFNGATDVRIVADLDEPGQAHAVDVQNKLASIGIEARIFTARHGKDAYDHLAAGHGLDDFDTTEPSTSDVPTSTPAELAHLVDWSEFWTQTHLDEEWVAWPLIPRGRTVALYAPAKAGKSTVMLAVIAAACTGQQPLGNNEHPQEKVSILYLDYEMTSADLWERLTALGYSAQVDLSRLHYALLPSFPPLDTFEGAQHLLRLAQELQVDAVVVDTFGRAVGGDENDADTVRAFYRHTGQHLKHHGIACIRTDHSGKDPEKGQRGSSAKNDDVDIVYKLTRTATGLTLARTHSRITWAPDTVGIDYTETDDGVDVRLTPRRQYPDGTVQLAQLLDDLGIEITASQRSTEQAVRDAGYRYRSSLIRAAAQMRKEHHLDPWGDQAFRIDSQPVDKSVDNPVDKSGRTSGRAPVTKSGRTTGTHSDALQETPGQSTEKNGTRGGTHWDALTESNRDAVRPPKGDARGPGPTPPSHDEDLDDIF